MSHHTLNARNLICPLPVIRAQQKIESLNHGDTLTVFATDPGAMHDVPAWCRVHGHDVIGCEESEHEVRIDIQICKA